MNYKSKYHRWNQSDRDIIKKNYLTKTNAEIAKILDRTPESVRKEFEKLKLKRPTKSQEQKQPKKLGRKPRKKNVFDAIQNGINERKRIEKEIKKEENRRKRLLQEAMWAANFVSKESQKKKIKSPDTRNMVSVRVDNKTVFFFDPSTSHEKIENRISAYKEKWCK